MKGIFIIGIILILILAMVNGCNKDRWLARDLRNGSTEYIMVSDKAHSGDTIIYEDKYYILLNRAE